MTEKKTFSNQSVDRSKVKDFIHRVVSADLEISFIRYTQ